MNHLVGDNIGLIHLIASIIALISGTMILFLEKGNLLHRKTGKIYVISMSILIVSAFFIYRLFNGWGIFHYTNILSMVTLLFGMVPVWMKKPLHSWKYLHFSFMYWSVMGLYAAFAAEVLTRIPETPFFGMVGIATFIIMLTGGIFFVLNKKKWATKFG